MTPVKRLIPLAICGSLLGFAASPAGAVRLDVGIGTVLGRSGVHVGTGYRIGRGRDRFGTSVYLDASRYVNRRKKRRERPAEDLPDRRREERTSSTGRIDERPERRNVRLKVAPGDTWVYLNGIRVEAYGRSQLALPPGKYRLEFVRPGYRTEVAELKVQAGVSYDVERNLPPLQAGEAEDERIGEPDEAVSVQAALASLRAGSTRGGGPVPARDRISPE